MEAKEIVDVMVGAVVAVGIFAFIYALAALIGQAANVSVGFLDTLGGRLGLAITALIFGAIMAFIIDKLQTRARGG